MLGKAMRHILQATCIGDKIDGVLKLMRSLDIGQCIAMSRAHLLGRPVVKFEDLSK